MQDLLAIRFLPGTKISHDYDGKDVTTFSYRDLWERRIPAIGIPCKQNRLVIIDVDVQGPTHQHDGREYWFNFCKEFGVPPTYTVQSPSGGFHFYFKLPEAVNPDTFAPPDELALGVDVKWNGWVGAPPTPGYSVYWGDLTQVRECPPSLMAEFSRLRQGAPTKTFDVNDPNAVLNLHRPFNEAQLTDLRMKLEWLQQNGTLTRPQWRDGLFALKAGIEDEALLDEFVCRWTMNKSYSAGDEHEARKIVERAEKHGPIGPGTIFNILNEVRRLQGVPDVETPFTIQQILDRSRVHKKIAKDGSLIIECSESNAAALIGAIFDDTKLYHDIRSDLYIFKGKSHSDSELVSQFIPMLQSPAYGLGLEKFRRQTVAAGLEVLMATRRKDPHVEYLKSLQWDGQSRIETFFSRYVGAEDSEYTRKVGLNFWTALAARGLNPGCKLDTMLILEGSEGVFKSSFIEAIAGQYTYAPIKKDFANDLDILRQMHQSVITELPELIGIVGQNSNFVKALLAKPFDNIRGLWARKAMRNERGFVFVGTTNDEKYLALDMGSRRFWPIKVPKGQRINLSGIKADRDQLFAEGIAMWRDGYPYWDMPKELLDPVIEGKVLDEPLMGPIREILSQLGPEWTTTEVYKRLEHGGYINRGMTSVVVNRIEQAFKRLGCERDGYHWRSKQEQFNQILNVMVAYQHQQQSVLGSFI